jgi:hypothetical protein
LEKLGQRNGMLKRYVRDIEESLGKEKRKVEEGNTYCIFVVD